MDDKTKAAVPVGRSYIGVEDAPPGNHVCVVISMNDKGDVSVGMRNWLNVSLGEKRAAELSDAVAEAFSLHAFRSDDAN